MEQIKLKIIIITSGVSRIIQPLIDSDLNIVGIIESMPKQFDPQYRDPFIIRQLKKLYNFFNKMPESLRSLANQKPYHIHSYGKKIHLKLHVGLVELTQI